MAKRGIALLMALGVTAALGAPVGASAGGNGAGGHRILGLWEVQSLDGSGNNPWHPTWGMGGTIYPRDAPASYADGISEPPGGPNPRYISNRIMSDTDQHLMSERNVSQWAFVWGQFLDHTFAQRLGRRGVGEPGEPFNIEIDTSDPMELFPSNFGIIPMDRSVAAPGTGVSDVREQINTHGSYIDALTVYGMDGRLEWLREGSVDGNLRNNNARLILDGGYLPRRTYRGDWASSPNMVAGGRLFMTPELAAVTGDARANENPPLLALHTLFAREHNRIVSQLPRRLSEQDRFEIARAIVIAEMQYITYNEFLPALGVSLPAYRGYRSNVNSSISNEFATVGYRAHSQIRGDFRIEAGVRQYTPQDLRDLEALGAIVTTEGDRLTIVLPLGEDAFFNPDLLELVQLGPLLKGIGLNPQHRNDELIDNMLRSFPFDIDIPAENPNCLPDPALPPCINGINDLGAIDIARSRDHGMPSYNELRVAMGLPAKRSFRAITGERSERFPSDPQLTPGQEIDDVDSLDFVELYDINGNPTTPEAGDATSGVRRTALAARLKAVYGDVNNVDAFVGMMAEPHVPGSEFGELQLAMWRKAFTNMRDGDRFFYGNDPLLPFVRVAFGVDYRKSLGDIISMNAGVPRSEMERNVFLTAAGQNLQRECRWLPRSWCRQLKLEQREMSDYTEQMAPYAIATRRFSGPRR